MKIRNRYGDPIDLEQHRKDIAAQYAGGNPPRVVLDARDVLDALERALNALPIERDDPISGYEQQMEEVRKAAGVVQ